MTDMGGIKFAQSNVFAISELLLLGLMNVLLVTVDLTDDDVVVLLLVLVRVRRPIENT